jgi:hypothetical protein
MTDRRELAENLRLQIRRLEAEIEEYSAELRRILQPDLKAVPDKESTDG